MIKNIPVSCPACASRLHVEKLECSECGTTVQGHFDLPVIMQLTTEEQEFVLMFLKASGSLKEMAKQLGYSYPKVRNMLDDVIARVKELEPDKPESDA